MFNLRLSPVQLLIISLIVPCQSSENQENWECRIKEIRGFLNYVCESQDGNQTLLKCHNSDEMYTDVSYEITKYSYGYAVNRFILTGFIAGKLCAREHDPYFYQACKRNPSVLKNMISMTNTKALCGQYLCHHDPQKSGIYSIELSLGLPSYTCNGINDCNNTDLDETGCSGDKMTTLPSGKSVPSEEICNAVCYDQTCEDEAVCNGYTYGLYCDFNQTTNTSTYVSVHGVCDRKPDCTDGTDESNCNVTNTTLPLCKGHQTIKLPSDELLKFVKANSKLKKIIRRMDKAMGYERVRWSYGTLTIPVHNFTKCYAIRVNKVVQSSNFIEYCVDYIPDQTNCTDPDKAALVCKVNGYTSTVSRHMVCLGKQICDDNFENHCIRLSETCYVHKHLICDGKIDCEIDNADENQIYCDKYKSTEEKCRRRVEIKPAKEETIPLIWLNDEVKDCVDGRDETSEWPTCGQGISLRFVNNNRSCENVFVCPRENPSYVELGELCDGIETCGNENEVCSESLGSPTLFTVPLTTDRGLSKHFSFCMKGLKETQNFMKNCTTMHSFFFPDGDVFGVSKTNLTLPANLQDCDHMFGEQYIYTSCTNKCINSSCPLDSQKNLPRYEVCPGQYPDRIGTIVDNKYLIFVTKTFGNIFTNNYFVCHNKQKCIDYSKVCDLVRDCGDDSDEKNCSNHFQCESTGRYIPKTRKCDGRFDCLDLSDECNDQCSSYIVEHSALKGLSWLIGILATLANLTIITKNIATLKRCRTTVALFNKALILAISFGDLLVGCYLIVISVYDGIIYKGSYCKNQIDWITSTKCSMIGVLSTLGSQLSLFAMCVLSATRFVGIRNSMKVPGEVTLVKSLQVTTSIVFMILSSLSIAAVPIIGRFEDFFVNGIRYPKQLKIFAGTPNKQKVLAILEAYYGRMKKATLSWRMIREMVKGIYSHDFQFTEFAYPDHTASVSKVDFYGNDGVCLFKYFVKNQDPQRNFVWTILALNFTCFIFISVSYMIIGYMSYRSSKSLTQSGANQLISQRNRKMNRKISIIILTDFLCWIPFIVTCILHSIEVLDATPWYSLFSIIILPINSVINPLIYDDTISSLISSPIRRFGSSISDSRVIQGIRRRFGRQTTGETIELENMNTT